MNIDQVFAGMEAAPIFGKGQYFSEGEFTLMVKGLKVNNGYNGLCFIAEFEVLASTSEKDPVGSTRSWIVKMGPTNKNAFSDIKALVLALTGKDPKRSGSPAENPELHAKAAKLVKAACDAEYAKTVGIAPDVFEGAEVGLRTFAKATRPTPQKPEGGTFTVHDWFPAPEPAGAAA